MDNIPGKNNTHEIDQIAAAVAARIKPELPISIDLWSSTELAAYFKQTPYHTLQRVASHPTFPRPVRIPTTQGKGHPRWKAREVIAWAESFQE